MLSYGWQKLVDQWKCSSDAKSAYMGKESLELYEADFLLQELPKLIGRMVK